MKVAFLIHLHANISKYLKAHIACYLSSLIMDSLSFKISLQILITLVIFMLVINVGDGDKMSSYIQIYLS